jgi:hypothetical protein
MITAVSTIEHCFGLGWSSKKPPTPAHPDQGLGRYGERKCTRIGLLVKSAIFVAAGNPPIRWRPRIAAPIIFLVMVVREEHDR